MGLKGIELCVYDPFISIIKVKKLRHGIKIINPRQWRGGGGRGWCNLHDFFWAGRHTVWSIVLKFSIAYGASFAQLLVRNYDVIRGTTFDKISAKSWENATGRGAIDLNGDSWCDWCQYMTRCDSWHCIIWVSYNNSSNQLFTNFIKRTMDIDAASTVKLQ